MESRAYINRLTIRLLDGDNLSNVEQADLMNWLKEHHKDQKLLADLSNIWTNLDSDRELSGKIIDSQWQKLHNSVISKPADKLQVTKKPLWRIVGRYAAIFILGLLAAFGANMGYQNYIADPFSSQVVIQVPYGSKSHVSLTDGSKVILNSGSELKYSPQFGKKNREVSIEGEACFKVSTDYDKPFVVKTSGLIIRAYGTEFNVRSYGEDNEIEATLLEGCIGVQMSCPKIQKRQNEFFLQPNEQVIFNKTAAKSGNTCITIKRNIDSDLRAAWINNSIHVKNEPLSSLAIKLERTYNVNIHIEDDELRTIKFSGIFENETIEQIMLAIKLSSSINFKIKNREIWLFKECNVPAVSNEYNI